jgi:hypothetical protein
MASADRTKSHRVSDCLQHYFASLLQGRLVAATSAAASADGRVEDLQQRLAAAAVRRAREVAAARAAGEVQLQTLQDAVQRLGQRDEMAGQVGSAVGGLLGCFGVGM